MAYQKVQPEIQNILNRQDATTQERLTEVCEVLRANFQAYDWVGFYFANHDTRTLHLEAYAGLETDHTEIPFGKGICGQVAESNSNFVVPDVQAQDNYIACSIYVKAEIVVPLFKDGKNMGQIDIDSNTPDPFTEEDERLLEWVNAQVAEIL